MHDTYAHLFGTNAGDADVEDIRIFNYGDGISQGRGGSNWRVRRVYVKYARDDCVSNDFYHAGTIEDSFFDGCYVGISARAFRTIGDSSANVIIVRKSLIRLGAVDRAYGTSAAVPNHNGFWKWPAPKDADTPRRYAPRLALYDNVFRADAPAWGGNTTLVPPSDKLVDCANNTMVWLGRDGFPEANPYPTACFRVTTDRAVWDSAVSAWHAAHPRPPSLLDVAPPIVSMFRPGRDTTLAGTVTLWATASDDRGVVGVRFVVGADSIGIEQTSPTAYQPQNRRNWDLVNKYRITWTATSGRHVLRAVARDSAGNRTISDSITVTVN